MDLRSNDKAHLSKALGSVALASMVLAAVVLHSAPARASYSSSPVRDFFAAVERHDFNGAIALTTGAAALVAGKLLGSIDSEAHRQHAKLDLKVRSLHLVERTPSGDGRIPVEVTYDVDVMAKTWLFEGVARRLSGTARFYVAALPHPHITEIIGHFAP